MSNTEKDLLEFVRLIAQYKTNEEMNLEELRSATAGSSDSDYFVLDELIVTAREILKGYEGAPLLPPEIAVNKPEDKAGVTGIAEAVLRRPERTGEIADLGSRWPELKRVDDLADWRYDVANGDTRLGFEEWLEHNHVDDDEETKP